MKKTKSLRAAMIADLERSGIPESALKQLQFAPRNEIETRLDLGLKWRCVAQTYQIPYLNPDGSRSGFNRYRLLEGSWNTNEPKASSYRYNQKLGTLPHLYFPPVIKWPLNKQGKIALPYLCITEGEKKAIKACLTGIPTVALGGVYSFAAKKKQINLLEEFDLFDLSETSIEICFDSDVHSNENVRAAMNKLASELTPLTSKPLRYIMLDGESTDKKGLDDFLASFKTPAKAELAFWALPRQEDKRSAAVIDFDASLVFVRSNSKYFNVPDRRWYMLKNDICNEFENVPKVPHPDKPDLRVSPVKIWFDQRKPETTIQEIVYEPGKEPRYHTKKGDAINVWRPSSIKPHDGTPKPWLELFEFLTSSLTTNQRKWLMQWFAYPVQHMGAKMHQSVFIHSHAEGIGKNLLVEPFIRNIYGEENYSRVEGDAIEDSFNAWISRKQFVFIDEVHVGTKNDRIKAMNRLKSYITNPTLEVNEKYTPRHRMKNCANLYITSQHSDGLMMSDKDRRMFVVEGPRDPMPDSFYRDVVKFAVSKHGIGQVLTHLMSVDLTDFNPGAHAPHTAAKENAVLSAEDPSTYYVRILKQNPAEIFSVNGRLPDLHLLSPTDICKAINAHSASTGSKFWMTPNSLGKYLANSGIQPRRFIYRAGKSVARATLYPVFRRQHWEAKTNSDWLNHIKRHDPRFQKTEVKIQLETIQTNGKGTHA